MSILGHICNAHQTTFAVRFCVRCQICFFLVLNVCSFDQNGNRLIFWDEGLQYFLGSLLLVLLDLFSCTLWISMAKEHDNLTLEHYEDGLKVVHHLGCMKSISFALLGLEYPLLSLWRRSWAVDSLPCVVAARLIKGLTMKSMDTTGHKWTIHLHASGRRMLCITFGWVQECCTAL